MEFITTDPANGNKLKTYQHMTETAAIEAVEHAYKTYLAWKKVPLAERAQAVAKWADNLQAVKSELAECITHEMGKPLAQSKAEIDKSIKSLRYLAENGPSWLAPIKTPVDQKTISVEFQPIGPVFAIMPWNFPLWQVARCAGPAMLAGNTVLLKHADRTAGSAEILVRAAKGLFKDGEIFQHTQVNHKVAEKMIAHPRLRAVSFTGSTRGGTEIATTAAKWLKKTVLELGGSDPYIVLDDADLEAAAKTLAEGRLQNAGQSCIAAKRFLVSRKVLAPFKEKLMAQMKTYTLGDPSSADTKLGPMASKEFAEQLQKQVGQAVEWGGEVLMGGKIDSAKGAAYFPPTLIEFKKNPEGLKDEEFFGPVACLIPFDTDEEAIAIANHSVFGLGSGVISQNQERAHRVARQIESGAVAINDFVKSDIRVPFGGVKQSGWGRELSSFGIHEFCNIQSIG